jgi:hypothetical protein
MQFIVPRRDRLPPGAIELAYLANLEESPYRTFASWQGDRLALDRDEAESATLTIPWIAGDRPPLALSTGTLAERPRPYLLPVELARGTIYRLRSYAFAWQSLGLLLPDGFEVLLHQVLETFARAATSQDHTAAAELAEQALDAALVASGSLCGAYGEQSVPARRAAASRAPFLIGVTLDELPPEQSFAERALGACNTLSVPFVWRRIEPAENARSWELFDAQIAWCQRHQVRICGGPLVRLDAGALPEWLDPAAGFDTVLARIERYLLAVVERYAGRVQLWNCAAGLNTDMGLPVTEEQRLRLAVRTIEIVRAADPNTPIIITIDQPWGEFLRDERRQLSPIHLADVLVRGDLGLSGFGMRINIDLARHATLPRDVLEISRQMDRWSVFNLPLLIELTLPPGKSQPDHVWIKRVVPVLLGKPAVQAVFWGQLSDGRDSKFPDRGLFDRAGSAKPAFQAFCAIRGLVE